MRYVRAFIIVILLAQINIASAEKLYLKIGLGEAHQGRENADVDDSVVLVTYTFNSETSKSYQVAIGYNINKYLSTEISVQHNSNYDLKGNILFQGINTNVDALLDFDTTSLMIGGQLNIATLFNRNWIVQPYIGLSAGIARHNVGDQTFDPDTGNTIFGETTSEFAWRGTFGLMYPISENFTLDVSYSYADYGEALSDRDGQTGGVFTNRIIVDPIEFNVKNHETLLSIRYLF